MCGHFIGKEIIFTQNLGKFTTKFTKFLEIFFVWMDITLLKTYLNLPRFYFSEGEQNHVDQLWNPTHNDRMFLTPNWKSSIFSEELWLFCSPLVQPLSLDIPPSRQYRWVRLRTPIWSKFQHSTWVIAKSSSNNICRGLSSQCNDIFLVKNKQIK